VWIWELANKRVDAYRKPAGRKYLALETYNEPDLVNVAAAQTAGNLYPSKNAHDTKSALDFFILAAYHFLTVK
jgi:hypothetical protein